MPRIFRVTPKVFSCYYLSFLPPLNPALVLLGLLVIVYAYHRREPLVCVQLPHFGHQVLAAEEAEDCDGVVFIQNPKGPENLVQGGAAGGDVVYNEDILVLDS